jgi:hypothetical protein
MTRHHDVSLCIVRFVTGGDRRADHARPAGLARLREAINSRLEETSFRTALAGCAAALIVIVTAVAVALLLSGQGAAGGQGTAADQGAAAGVAPSVPAGTAGTAGTTPTHPTHPRSRPIAVPSASPATPAPAASSPAASSPSASSPAAIPTASVPDSAPSATGSPSHCPPGQAKHHRC